MMKEKRNSRIRLFALLVLVFTLGFGFSLDTSKTIFGCEFSSGSSG